MKIKSKHAGVAGGLALGFVVGGVVGLIWGQQTRQRAAGATETSYSDGVITVEFDAGQAALGGIRQYLQ